MFFSDSDIEQIFDDREEVLWDSNGFPDENGSSVYGPGIGPDVQWLEAQGQRGGGLLPLVLVGFGIYLFTRKG